MYKYVCEKCGRNAYSAASPETVDGKCPNPGCGDHIVPVVETDDERMHGTLCPVMDRLREIKTEKEGGRDV